MATGRVWVGFLCIRTRPAGLTLKPEPAPFIKRVFFLNPDPPRRAPRALRAPPPQVQSVASSKKKKKKMPESLSRVEQKTSQQCKTQ